MTALVLRGMRERKLRSALTALAVLLGVAMVAGTYVQTDRITRAFDDIQGAAYQGTDVVVRAGEAFDSDLMGVATFDEALVERIRAVPGVAKAEGSLEEFGSLVVRGKKVGASLAPTSIVAQGSEPFTPARIVDGRFARGPGEVTVDRDLFEDQKLELGERIGVATRTGVQRVRVVGYWRYGDVSSIGGAQVVAAPLAQVQRWFDRPGEVTEIAVAAQPGTEPEALAAAVRDAVGARGVEVSTGDQRAQASAKEINDEIGGFLTPALLAFAGAAVLVGAFIIFNTFSITVAQRTREFALLRSLGASRGQIVAAVVGEALVIGLVASGLGILAGLGFAAALGAMFDAAGFGIPRAGIVLEARTIAISLAVGVGVTVIAALVPAVRATRIPPVAALAGHGVPVAPGRRWVAPAVAAVTSALGLAGLLGGLFASGPATARLSTMAGGAVFLFIGIALSARWFVRPLAAAIGWPVERAFATPGRLARENAQRAPGRTATTSAALMIGIGLVAFVAVFAAGLKSSIDDSVGDLISADLIVVADGFGMVPEKGGEAIEAVDGVAAVTPFLLDRIQVDGKNTKSATDTLDGVDVEQLAATYDFEWVDGSDAVLASLRGDTALVEKAFAEAHGIERGETFAIRTPAGRSARLTAAAVYEDPMILSGTVVAEERFRELSTVRDPFGWFVGFADGADGAAVRRAVEAAVAPFPAVKVQTLDEYTEDIRAQMDQLVSMLYALLAMSVVISLFGIANSLFLSIHERTREFGLLRAVGATRGQVRRIVRYESVITSVIGGVLGVAIGILLAGLMTAALSDLGLGFSVPVVQVIGFLVLAVVVGMVGAIVPARRGARLDVLEALRQE